MAVFGPYHRLESPTRSRQDARTQELTALVCGKAARWSDVPSVKAYTGPLPKAARGIEFTTEVAPRNGSPPHSAYWRQGGPGVINSGDEMVCIPAVTRINTQV